jgi:O-antigen/teichoic acid export membrane protein
VQDLLQRAIKRIMKSRIVRDSGILLVANWSAMALSVVTSIVITHLLGSTPYGLMILTISIVNVIVQFLDIRTGEAMVRFVGNAVAREAKEEAFTFFTVGLTTDTALMIATMAAVLIAAPKAALIYPDRDLLQVLIRIYMLSIPFSTLEGSFQAVLTVHKRFNLSAIGRIVVALGSTAALLLLAPYGIAAAMWGQTIGAMFSFTVWLVLGGTLIVRQIGIRRPVGYIAAWKAFIPFAFHNSVRASIKALMANMDSLLLGALLPVSTVAYYRIASSAVSLINMPTAPVSTVIYQEMIEAWAIGKVKRVRELIRKYTLVSIAAAGSFWVFFLVTANWLVALLYPPDFSPAAGLIRILGIEMIIQSTLRWVRPAAMSVNKPQLVTYYGLIEIILRMGALIVFIFYWGVVGAAWSNVTVMVIMVFVQVFYVTPRLGLDISQSESKQASSQA